MEVLQRNSEPCPEELDEMGIDCIYYNSKDNWIAEYTGGGYTSSSGDELSEKEMKNISNRVKIGGGEKVSEDEAKFIKENCGFDFDF